MDVYVFSSRNKTQGMVLAEACVAGVPVVALDGSGVGDVIEDGKNGRLVPNASEGDFVEAIKWVEAHAPLSVGARETAKKFAIKQCAERALELYEHILGREHRFCDLASSDWSEALRVLEAEWDIWSKRVGALQSALSVAGEDGSPQRVN